jgi:DNA-binding beta-propeller fold protein YncE
MAAMRLALARKTPRGAAYLTAAIACCAACVCAGCTAAATHAAGAAPAGTTALPTPSAPPSAASPPPPALPARALAAPGCSTATAASPALGSVSAAMLPVSGSPFGVAATAAGRWAFVAVVGPRAGRPSIDVLRLAGSRAPTLVRSIPVPGMPLGVTITPDGKYLLAADNAGVAVLSVARAESGAAGAVLGTLSAPGSSGATAGGGPAGGAIEVAASPDGRFAFVTLEDSQRAAVFNLGAALSRGFGPADYVGSIPLGLAPVGITVSPGGRWLYATSEIATRGTGAARPVAGPAGPGGALSAGTLTVIDLRRAETDPAASVVATVDAGCQPVRVTTAADGTQVWVTARASDDLLCFAAARLISDPKRALVAAVRVGEAPVGLAAVRESSLVLVADSNRFGAGGATSDLDVVNVAAALAGRPAVVGHIRAGLFPRDMTLAPDGTLLVSNFDSGQVEAVDVATVPGTPG